MTNLDKKFMQFALQEAKIALTKGEIPVGAVIVKNGEIIAKTHNEKEILKDVTAHAEIIAIKEASEKLQEWRLENTCLYVTLEPCPMCAAAILYSRIPKIIFGAYDPLSGAFGSNINMCEIIKTSAEIKGGILEQECSLILKEFFSENRKKHF